MNFKSLTTRDEITWLQGYVDASYYELHAAFGAPLHNNDGKTRREWRLEFDDGTLATIYDWKKHDTRVEDVLHWNIGGRSPDAVHAVQSALDDSFMRLMESTVQYDEDPYSHMEEWSHAG